MLIGILITALIIFMRLASQSFYMNQTTGIIKTTAVPKTHNADKTTGMMGFLQANMYAKWTFYILH